MSTMIFIMLLGIFSYFNIKAARNFRGNSIKAKNALLISGTVGYWSFYAFIIWSFFLFEWWLPVVVFVLDSIVGAIFDLLFSGKLYGMILSLIACPIFWILSLVSLLCFN